jgi:hypothetical protein
MAWRGLAGSNTVFVTETIDLLLSYCLSLLLFLGTAFLLMKTTTGLIGITFGRKDVCIMASFDYHYQNA